MKYTDFLKETLTPHHTSEFLKRVFTNKGYKEYNFNTEIQLNTTYFYIYRTLVICFNVPLNPKNFRIIGTHSDSPVLKLKPQPFFDSNGLTMLNLKTYGGGLWHTYFDRPLTLAGIIIRKEGIEVIKIENAAYIPSLAPHVTREVYKQGFSYNKEDHLKAILLKKEIKELLKDSLSHELSLMDDKVTETEDYIISGRQDNISSTYCAIDSFLNHKSNHHSINMVAIFDSEEIGSATICGAKTSVFSSLLQNISLKTGISDYTSSFFLSVDAGHVNHPNYPEVSDKNFPVKFKGGVALKYGAGYSTECYGSALINSLAAKKQIFCVRNGDPCGGTIGTMICIKLGIPSVDIGVPLLGMHSISEVCDKEDISSLIDLLKEFLENEDIVK